MYLNTRLIIKIHCKTLSNFTEYMLYLEIHVIITKHVKICYNYMLFIFMLRYHTSLHLRIFTNEFLSNDNKSN